MAKKDEAQTAEEILKAKLDLYNKLIHLPHDKITPEEVNIMFELSRDKKVLAWIDKKLYGKGNQSDN